VQRALGHVVRDLFVASVVLQVAYVDVRIVYSLNEFIQLSECRFFI